MTYKSTAEKLDAHKDLAEMRIVENATINANKPLGPVTKAVSPEDKQLMWASKMAMESMEQNQRIKNAKAAFMKEYEEDPDTTKKMEEWASQFSEDRKKFETRLKRHVSKHPLTMKLCKIKGLGEFSLGLVIGMIKNISKFPTPSALCVYAGIGTKYGMPVTKANLHKIKKLSIERDNKEFKGFNTKLSGRMYCISESLVKAKTGWCHKKYQATRERLEKRAVNEGSTYMPTPEEIKKSKGSMKAGQLYMKNKNAQSLKMWSHKNSMRRLSRLILHLIYHEWKLYKDEIPRLPYAIEYLGHTDLITIEEIIAFDSRKVDKNEA